MVYCPDARQLAEQPIAPPLSRVQLFEVLDVEHGYGLVPHLGSASRSLLKGFI